MTATRMNRGDNVGSYGRQIDGVEVVEKVHNEKSPWRNIVPDVLKDCPRCGAKQSDRMLACSYFGFKINADGWAAYCRNCKASTPFCETHDKAIKKWNEGDVT